MVFEKVKQLIVEQLEVDADQVTMETDFMKDLEADSLDAVEIILGVEDEYGIEIPDEEVPLAAAPKTGDISSLWAALSSFSAAGFFLLGRKRKDEE